MEEKSNNATPLRPEGKRVLNAPAVEMDLNKFIVQIRNEETWKSSGHNSITIFKSDQMRIVLIGLHDKAVLKKHHSNAVISVQVIEGNIVFVTPDESYSLTQGQMIALQPNIPHSVEAKCESFFLLTLASVS
ncbi:MAG: hypothetical protein J5I59_03105 [Saprospiraceae bacterium]|nr:hypothetical protein [Saprospiraceae bacterium]